MDLEYALKLAKEYLKNAYAPYSNIRVSSVVYACGKHFVGVNVENSSYGLTICAERVAVFKAVSEGCRTIEEVLVYSEDIKPYPCGACLQVIAEFSRPNTKIYVASPEGIEEYELRDLLPKAFKLGEKRVFMAEKYTVARLRIGRKRFEVLVDPKKALMFREGEPIDIREVVPDFTIFEDVRKGKLASKEEVLDAFRKYLRKPDVTIEEIVKTIVLRGEVEIPQELRREIYEKVKREVINRIHRYAINPKTGKPHPPKRIEAAMEEVGVKIDPKKPVPMQAVEIVKALSRVIPIGIPYIIIHIQVPPDEAREVYRVIMRYEKLFDDLRSARKNDGSLEVVAKIKEADLELIRREIARVSKKATLRVVERIVL